jgi:Lsr2
VAQNVIMELVDDVDGSPASKTRRFSVDGKNYQVDLSDKNNAAFDKALAKWVRAAQQASGGSRRRRTSGGGRRSRGSNGVDPRAVRVWASEKGITIAARGRIPGTVVEQFRASGGK